MDVWSIVKWPVLLVIVELHDLAALLGVPERQAARLPVVTPGGLLAVVLWIAASALFALYVAKFSSYNKTYGSTRRRDRVPHLAVDHEHHHPARRRVQFGDGALSKAIQGGHPPEQEPYLPLRDEPKA